MNSAISRKSCRFCAAPLDLVMADLGKTPLSNAYVTAEQAARGLDQAFPLIVRVCKKCWLVQADEVVDHSSIFDENYMYFSSYSSSWVAHAEAYATEMRERFALPANALVIEVASNDGYLLQHFLKAGHPVLGIEPTRSTAEAAIAKGITTHVDYFGRRTAERLKSEGYEPALMAANNVLAHVPDIKDFVAGFATLLASEGVVTFEFPHLLNLMRLGQFDTIYHEHYSYLSLLFVSRLLNEVGLRVFDVEKLPTHGGSLRVYGCHRDSAHPTSSAVDQVLREEVHFRLDSKQPYETFAKVVDQARTSFRAFLDDAKRQGKTVYGYGAAAKGNTLLNVCGVTSANVKAVADLSNAKQGKLLPGSHIPIVAPEVLMREAPDFVVILPWNLKDEILEQLAELSAAGTRFVIAIPEVQEV